MNVIVWANIFGFAASGLVALASFRKERNDILKIQVIVCVLNLIANLLLGVYPAMTTGVISTFCTFLNSKEKLNKRNAYIMAILIAVIGVAINTKAIPGLLVPIASVEYLILSQSSKNAQQVRIAATINLLIYILYDCIFMLYSVAVMDAIICGTVVFNIVKFRREENG